MKALVCRHCGSPNLIQDGSFLKCKHCETTYQIERENKVLEKMRDLIDEAKREKAAELRPMLYEQLQIYPPDSKTIVDICMQIKDCIPDDFVANFYYAANVGYEAGLIKFVNEIDVVANYPFVETCVKYVIRSLTSNLILPVGNLIERASQSGVIDVKKYNELQTLFETEAEKVENDVYNPRVPRDCFVMYSGKDMDEVMRLVSFLESQDVTCFVALRNIQHGRGSREEYISLLKSAIDHCECILFVSSNNSRHTRCEAVSVEMDYIMQREKDSAPPEYRNLPYHKLPSKYKKHRVEYLIELPNGANIMGERIVKQFFYGLEYVKADPQDALIRIKEPATPTPPPPTSGGDGEKEFKNKNYDDAFGAFEEQAMTGDVKAMCNLGYCYEVGLGIDRDCEEAVKWYKKAANGGNARAQYNLGICYDAGIGVDRDPDKAYDLISSAARDGDPLAKEWMKSN